MTTTFLDLPSDLPMPLDDGAAAHLQGAVLPDVALPSTDGSEVRLSGLQGRWVIYIYPMTGRPGVALPEGWDQIPGARGCTPQACGFRDQFGAFRALGIGVVGLSAQDSSDQQEARDRLQLPFHLLSDNGLRLKGLLRLPTFRAGERELYKRLTLIIEGGLIEKVFYPVFPPDRSVDEVLAWVREETR